MPTRFDQKTGEKFFAMHKKERTTLDEAQQVTLAMADCKVDHASVVAESLSALLESYPAEK